MLYDVYIWLLPTSEAAEVFQQVQAEDAEDAVQLVMQRCALRSASYAWVVPEDETLDCSSFAIQRGGICCCPRQSVGIPPSGVPFVCNCRLRLPMALMRLLRVVGVSFLSVSSSSGRLVSGSVVTTGYMSINKIACLIDAGDVM